MSPVAKFFNLEPGVKGADAKAMKIFEFAVDADQHPEIRRQAELLVKGRHPKDVLGMIRDVNAWVRDHLEWLRDPTPNFDRKTGERVGGDFIKAPWVILEQISEDPDQVTKGDCDDHASLAVALLRSIGIKAGVRIIWSPTNKSQEPDHIYAIGWDGSRWVALDATNKNQPAGIERAAGRSRRYEL